MRQLVLGAATLLALSTQSEPKLRRFDLQITLPKPAWASTDAKLRLWVPVPSSRDDQEVKLIGALPEGFRQTRDKLGNEMLYWEGAAGQLKLPATVEFAVARREILNRPGNAAATLAITESVRAQLESFLRPNKLVPVGGFVNDIAAKIGKDGDTAPVTARACYDFVLANMQYKKEGTGWGTGSTKWACEAGYGNCTDFHAYFISLCRTKKMPARFEIGYSLPDERGKKELGGYHCWAYFWLDGQGWIPVDISEADKHPEMADYYFGALTENRFRLSTERDLVLEPPQAGEPLNFFCRPYAELDGKPQPFDWQLAIEDL